MTNGPKRRSMPDRHHLACGRSRGGRAVGDVIQNLCLARWLLLFPWSIPRADPEGRSARRQCRHVTTMVAGAPELVANAAGRMREKRPRQPTLQHAHRSVSDAAAKVQTIHMELAIGIMTRSDRVQPRVRIADCAARPEDTHQETSVGRGTMRPAVDSSHGIALGLPPCRQLLSTQDPPQRSRNDHQIAV